MLWGRVSVLPVWAGAFPWLSLSFLICEMGHNPRVSRFNDVLHKHVATRPAQGRRGTYGGCLVIVDVSVLTTVAHSKMFLMIPAWLHLGSKVGFKGTHSASERRESSRPGQSPGGEWWLGQHEAPGIGVLRWGGLLEGTGCCWPSCVCVWGGPQASSAECSGLSDLCAPRSGGRSVGGC